MKLYDLFLKNQFLTGAAAGTAAGFFGSYGYGIGVGVSTTLVLGFLDAIRMSGSARAINHLKLSWMTMRALGLFKTKQYKLLVDEIERILRYPLTEEGEERWINGKNIADFLVRAQSADKLREMITGFLLLAEETGIDLEEVMGDMYVLFKSRMPQFYPLPSHSNVVLEYAEKLIRRSPGIEIFGSKNKVRIIDDEGIRFFVSKTGDLDDLQAEMEAAEIIGEISGDLAKRLWRPFFFTVVPITILYNEDDYYYLMQYSALPLLSSKNDFDSYRNVARVSAAIHRLFPRDEIRGCERDLVETLEERVCEEYKDIIISNIGPVKKAIDLTESSYDVDAHPQNFGVGLGGDVLIMDTENYRMRKVVFDWVNLMDHNRVLSGGQKEKIIEEIFDVHDYFGVVLPPEVYKLGYYNAVIARTFELYRILVEERHDSHHARDMVYNSLDAIEMIERDFSKYFADHRKNYTFLREALTRQIAE